MMKKYLMTGMAAVALCAAFTSCSNKEDIFSQEGQTEYLKQQVELNYNNAFVATFGQPGSGQDWGFGSTAKTRTHNANGNMWATEEGGNWKVPAALTASQKDVVRQYFQQKDLRGTSINYTNFFVQQVYQGGTNANTAVSTEVYTAADGTTTFKGGERMDQLIDGKGDHINNFNYGDAGTYNGVLYNDGTTGNDQIMLMVEASTSSFGYRTSNADAVYNNKFIIIDGATIDAWAKANGITADAVTGRYFVGFDYEQLLGESVYGTNWTAEGQTPAYYDEAQTIRYLSDQMNRYCASDVQNLDPEPDAAKVAELVADGYLPVQGKANKTWAKIAQCADGVYSDWIICVTPGEKYTDPGDPTDPTDPEYDVRIMAEDLNAGATDVIDGEVQESDWDFNDVVFDVKFDAEGNGGTIRLVAAGGVLPLTVAGQEVHGLFGLSADANGQYQMVNTGKGPTKPYVTFHIDNADKANRGKGIVIQVQKELANGVKEWFTLNANAGQPAAKIAVSPTVDYCSERQHITNKYPLFGQWVVSNGSVVWY